MWTSRVDQATQRSDERTRTVLDKGNCPHCFVNLCKIHPYQDHGQRAARLRAQASSQAALDKMYATLVAPQVAKLREPESQADYLSLSAREREQRLSVSNSKRKRNADDDDDLDESGLNPQVLSLMRQDDEEENGKKKNKKERKKKHKKHKKSSKKKKHHRSSSSRHDDDDNDHSVRRSKRKRHRHGLSVKKDEAVDKKVSGHTEAKEHGREFRRFKEDDDDGEDSNSSSREKKAKYHRTAFGKEASEEMDEDGPDDESSSCSSATGKYPHIPAEASVRVKEYTT